MKNEHPILFSGAMVRAIQRRENPKTQTRRVVKNPENFGCLTGDCPHSTQFECDQAIAGFVKDACPYGQVGHRLWVRETFCRLHEGLQQHLDPDPDSPHWWTAFRADGLPENFESYGVPCKPSIFMPRKFSRITLEITQIQVERLNKISEADAMAEGAEPSIVGRDLEHLQFRAGYQTLWEAINGAGSWDLNPWVWVVEFRKM